MSTHLQLLQMGPIEALVYAFDRAGEGLMMHKHDALSAHDVQVIQGSVVIYGEVPDCILRVGYPYKFDWSKNHQIVALENNTVIVNRFLNKIPEGYRNIPADKRSGVFENTLHVPVKYY